MTDVCGTMDNRDVKGFVPSIVHCIAHPETDAKTVSIIRNTARIIENMAKLVDDPYEIEPFIPVLLPQLERAKEEVSDPEARNVCTKAYDQLVRTQTQPPIWNKI